MMHWNSRLATAALAISICLGGGCSGHSPTISLPPQSAVKPWFTKIMITRKFPDSATANYAFSVDARGHVIYEGYKDVKVLGRREFEVATEDLHTLACLFRPWALKQFGDRYSYPELHLSVVTISVSWAGGDVSSRLTMAETETPPLEAIKGKSVGLEREFWSFVYSNVWDAETILRANEFVR